MEEKITKRVRKSRKFKTPKEFRDALWLYLDACPEKKEMPNIAGFCAFREIGKSTYYAYAKRYPHTKRAFEAVVENAWVQRLGGTSATGAIFYLKNAFREDFKDRNETDITTKGEKITNSEEIKALSDQFNEFLKHPRQA
jgi:hypothetical protein